MYGLTIMYTANFKFKNNQKLQECEQAFFYGLTGHTEVLCAANFKQKFYISGCTGPLVDENFIVALTYCSEKLCLY